MLDIICERVGITRSGKAIFFVPDSKDIEKLVDHFMNENFSSDDLLDILALYEFLALRAIRRLDVDAVFEEHANEILSMMSTEDLEEAKVRANIFSAFQLRDLGKSLAAIEFMDF